MFGLFKKKDKIEKRLEVYHCSECKGNYHKDDIDFYESRKKGENVCKNCAEYVEEYNENKNTFNCKATIEIPNEKVVFEYNCGNYTKYKNGIQVMSAMGRSYEDFIEQVIYQYPLNKTNKIIINMLSL